MDRRSRPSARDLVSPGKMPCRPPGIQDGKECLAGILLRSLGFFPVLLLPVAVSAGGLEERVTTLESENARLKTIIIQLQERLDALESMQPHAADRQGGTAQEPERATAVSAPPEKEDEGYRLTLLQGKKIGIGGELQLEYRDTQNESSHPAGSTDIPFGQFQIDKLDLEVEAELAEEVTLFAQIEAEPGEADLDEAHLTLTGLPFASYLRAGLQYRFIRPKRKTETYPLAGTAFWNDEDLGIEIGGGTAPLFYRLSLTNGLRLRADEIGEDDSFPIIQDDDENRDFNSNKQVGIGIGLSTKLFADHEITSLLFSYFSRLSDNDLAFLRDLPGYTSDRRTKNFYGGNLEYEFGGLTLFGQHIHARDGALTRDAWYVQPSYKFTIKGSKYLTAVEPLYRYDRLDIDHPPAVSDSLTWDRTRHTLAAILGLWEDAKLKLEYNMNDEETGGAEVDNHEFVGQLEIDF